MSATIQRAVIASYVALSGHVYTDDTHSDALFAAEEAGEPEAQGFPHHERFNEPGVLEQIESRMGFYETATGAVLTRGECLDRYGFDLAEDAP